MKKISICSIFFLLISILFFHGDVLASASKKRSDSWPKVLTIASTPVQTTGYVVASALGKRIEEKLGIPVTVTVSIGNAAIRLVVKGSAELCQPNEFNFYHAVRGIGKLKQHGKAPLRYLTFTYPLYVAAMSREKITSFSDLKGKKCMFDYPAVPHYMMVTDALLEFHGMKKDDLVILKSMRGGDVSDALIARTADAGMRMSPPRGQPWLKELDRKMAVNFLPLSDEEINYVIKKHPFFFAGSLSAGTTKGQDQPIKTLGIGQNLVVHKDLPEDLVYEIAGILMDSCGKTTPGDFTKYRPSAAWTLQDNMDALTRKVGPFHPGVVKYLKDRGVWTSEHDRIQAEMEALNK